MGSIKELVKDGKKAHFVFFSDGHLWYETDDGYKFRIPAEDAKGGIFRAEEKAIHMMRWIRKQMALETGA